MRIDEDFIFKTKRLCFHFTPIEKDGKNIISKIVKEGLDSKHYNPNKPYYKIYTKDIGRIFVYCFDGAYTPYELVLANLDNPNSDELKNIDQTEKDNLFQFFKNKKYGQKPLPERNLEQVECRREKIVKFTRPTPERVCLILRNINLLNRGATIYDNAVFDKIIPPTKIIGIIFSRNYGMDSSFQNFRQIKTSHFKDKLFVRI